VIWYSRVGRVTSFVAGVGPVKIARSTCCSLWFVALIIGPFWITCQGDWVDADLKWGWE
jgi:hypothetical protein